MIVVSTVANGLNNANAYIELAELQCGEPGEYLGHRIHFAKRHQLLECGGDFGHLFAVFQEGFGWKEEVAG